MTPRLVLAMNLEALSELANVNDEGAARCFLRKHPGFVKLPAGLREEIAAVGRPEEMMTVVLAGYLQRIWKREQHTDKLLTAMLIDPDPLKASDKWMSAQIRQIQAEPPDVFSAFSFAAIQSVLTADMKRGSFTYKPYTDFHAGLYELLTQSHRVKTCLNADCPAPYFVATRAQQMYCGPKCAESARRAAKLRYWNEVGAQRREKTKRKARKK